MRRMQAKVLQLQRMALAVLQERRNPFNRVLMKARTLARTEMRMQKRTQGHEKPQGLHQKQAQTGNEGFRDHPFILGR